MARRLSWPILADFGQARIDQNLAQMGQDGANLGPKSKKKRNKNNMKNRRIFHDHLDAKYHGKLTEIHPKMGSKIDEKTDVRATRQHLQNVLPAKAGTPFLRFRGVPNA